MNENFHCSRESYLTILIQRSLEDPHLNLTVLLNFFENIEIHL